MNDIATLKEYLKQQEPAPVMLMAENNLEAQAVSDKEALLALTRLVTSTLTCDMKVPEPFTE